MPSAYRDTFETASVPLIVALVFVGGALGASRFVAQNTAMFTLPAVAFPKSISLEKPLMGEAAALYDPHSGTFLYAKNGELQLPLASLTKLMTAAVVLQSASPETPVRISAKDLQAYGDSGLRPGEVWTLGNLVTFGLVASSNDAIAAAAAGAGGESVLELMNDEARRLGLAQTYFLDPTGLDLTDSTAGAYGSARDMALLAAAFLKAYPDMLETTSRDEVAVGHFREATSTSIPIHDIPGLIGAKTGYTDLAGGNLVAVFDADIGRPLVAVVLGSTETGRFEDMRALIEAARASLAAAAATAR